MIDFEILPADGPGRPAAVSVTSQYGDRGVTFNGPVALDYSLGSAIPGFTHSGTKAIEACYAGEFCTTPIEMTFTLPQQRVKLWVGSRLALATPRDVVLLGFDAADAEVVRATGTLGASFGPQPIRLPLEVVAPSPLIARVVLRFTPPSALTAGLAVDDVEFDSGAPATCASSRDPVVTIDAPADGSSAQTNSILLGGSIDAEAPLAEALLFVTGSGGIHMVDLLGTGSVNTAGGSFASVRLTGLLFPGANTLILRAGDCHGQTATGVAMTYTPIGADTRFTLEHLEVTQSTQGSNNDVPLIADKRTLARAYLRTTGSTATIRNVRGTLTACRPAGDDVPICGDFFPKLLSQNSITVTDSTDLATQRADPNGSLNFELPADWSSAGLLHLRIADLEIDGLPAEVPCDRCENPNVFGFPGFHQFKPTTPLSFLLFSVEYDQGGITYVPRFTDVWHLRSWLQRAYPTDRVIAPLIDFSAGFDSVPTASAVNLQLFLRKIAVRTYNGLFGWFGDTVDDSGVYYGIVYDGGVVGGRSAPYFMRGLSNDTRGVGSGPVGAPADAGFNWDVDQSYGDWYGGHEIGHLHGRDHPGFVTGMGGTCIAGVQDSSPVDTSFPYANGSIGTLGWDPGDASLGISAQILPPYTSSNVNTWTDMMTYCNFEWISDYTYEAILDRINSSAFTALDAAAPETVADALIVAGTMNLTRDTVDLAPFMRLADVPMDPRPAHGAYAIDLLDDDGGLLAHYPFTPEPDSDVPVGADVTALLAEVVPFDPATRRIVVAKDGGALASRTVSPHPPAVHLLSPNGGETLADPTAVVTWQGSDVDGDPLRYTVLYSIDAGASWFPLAVDVAGEAAVINLDDVPGSARARLRVIATDGVNTAIDDSDGLLIVPRKPPEVRITAPAPGTPLTTRQTIVFAGEAFDREDGDLEGEVLRWSSDRQGALGVGRSVAIRGLDPGRHVVTLMATDRDGQVGSAQLVVDVVADLPQAVIAAPRIVLRGAQVDLDASGSYGVGGLTYRWALSTTPAGSDARLLATDGASTALLTDGLGSYAVALVVRDAMGNVSTVRFAVTAVTRSDCIAATLRALFDGSDPAAATGCDANGDGFTTAADLTAAAGGA